MTLVKLRKTILWFFKSEEWILFEHLSIKEAAWMKHYTVPFLMALDGWVDYFGRELTEELVDELHIAYRLYFPKWYVTSIDLLADAEVIIKHTKEEEK